MALFKYIQIILLLHFGSINSVRIPLPYIKSDIENKQSFKDLSDFPNYLKSIYLSIDPSGFNNMHFDALFTEFYQHLKAVSYGKLTVEDFECSNKLKQDYIYSLNQNYLKGLIKKLVISMNHIARLAEDEEDYHIISDAIHYAEKDLYDFNKQMCFLSSDFMKKFVIPHLPSNQNNISITTNALISDFNNIYSNILKLHFANCYSLSFFHKIDIKYMKRAFKQLNSMSCSEFYDDIIVKRDQCDKGIEKCFVSYMKLRSDLMSNGFNILQYFGKVDIYNHAMYNICFYDYIYFLNYEEMFNNTLSEEYFKSLKYIFMLFLEKYIKLYNYNLCLKHLA